MSFDRIGIPKAALDAACAAYREYAPCEEGLMHAAVLAFQKEMPPVEAPYREALDALEAMLRQHCTTDAGEVIISFGCDGDAVFALVKAGRLVGKHSPFARGATFQWVS